MAAFQSIVVVVLVSASLTFSAWWLTPARRRLWVLDHLVSAHSTRGPLPRLRRALLAKAQIGCGACPANASAAAKHSTGKAAELPR